MNEHSASFQQYDGGFFLILTCACGKTFWPLVNEHQSGWREKEIVARKRHILHLEDVVLKIDYDARQAIKRANQTPDPFGEFKL